MRESRPTAASLNPNQLIFDNCCLNPLVAIRCDTIRYIQLIRQWNRSHHQEIIISSELERFNDGNLRLLLRDNCQMPRTRVA